MHGGFFQIKVPVHNSWWSLTNESPCTQCMVESFKLKSLYTMHGGHNVEESFKLKSLYTMHGGVFQIKVPVHNAWWSLSN